MSRGYLPISIGASIQAAVRAAIQGMARLARIDLLTLAYNDLGILKYQDATASGEEFVVRVVLKRCFQRQQLVVFDVGANSGTYSRLLYEAFPTAQIHAFEPLPDAFAALTLALEDTTITCVPAALGRVSGNQPIFTYASDTRSQHATLYKSVLADLHRSRDYTSVAVPVLTLDEYCAEQNVPTIDFLKIDTEGHELEVLRGGRRMLAEKRIKMVQFEFNEMNIVSRVFLRDFYQLLEGFRFYRMDSRRLIPLPHYQSRNEIFAFQNFLAAREDIVPCLAA